MNITGLFYPQEDKGKEFSEVIRETLTTVDGVEGLVLQPAIAVLEWMAAIRGHLVGPMRHALRVLDCSVQGLAFMELPERCAGLCLATFLIGKNLLKGNFFTTLEKSGELVGHSTSIASSVTGGIEIAYQEGLLTLSKATIAVFELIGVIGLSVLFCTSMYRAAKEAKAVLNADRFSKEFNFALSRLLLRIAVIAASAIGILGYALGAILVSEWVSLSLVAFIITNAIVSHFYGRMYSIIGDEDATFSS